MLNELEEKSVQQIDLAWIPRLRLSHGLRTPNEACFHRNPKLLFVIGQMNSGAFGVFSAKSSAPILALLFPCPYFPLFQQK